MWSINVAANFSNNLKQGKAKQKMLALMFLLVIHYNAQASAMVVMNKWGETSHMVETAHIKIRISLTETARLISELFANLHTLERNVRTSDDLRKDKYALMMAKCNELLRRLEHMTDLKKRFFDPQEGKRQKRFIGVLIISLVLLATAALAGTALGVYNLEKLEAMDKTQGVLLDAAVDSIEEIQTSSHKIFSLADLVVMTHKHARNSQTSIEQSQVHDWALRAAQDRIATIDNIFTAGMDGRLHASALYMGNMTRATEELKARADKLGYYPVAQFNLDLLQCDTTFISTQAGFDLFVHVPMINPKAAMAIYRHQPVPIKVTNDLFVTLSSSDQFLSISADASVFQTYTTAQMKECKRHGATYVICDNPEAVRKPVQEDEITKGDAGMCLYFLHQQNFAGAKIACDSHIHSAKEQVVQLSHNTFLVTSTKEQEAFEVCRDKNATRFTIRGQTKIVVHKDCYITTKYNKFSAGEEAKQVNLDSISYNWSEDHPLFPTHLLKEDNGEESNFEELVKRAMGNDTSARLSSVLEKVKEQQKLDNRGFLDWAADSWASICGSSGSTLILLAGLVLLYKCVTNKNHTQVSGVPAQTPAPTAIIIGPQSMATAPPPRQLPVNMQFIIQQEEEQGLRNVF